MFRAGVFPFQLKPRVFGIEVEILAQHIASFQDVCKEDAWRYL